MGSVWRSMVVLTVVTMAAAIGRVGAQQQGQDCATQLLPSLSGCLEAVQDPTKKPSSDCCKGVADVVKNQLSCLCELYKTPPTGIPLNMTRILEIPTLCKVSASISQCKTGNSSTHTPATSAPSPASSKAPAPTSGSDKQSNGALRLTWSLKPLWALGLLWASLLLKPWA
ncbi:YLS3 protein [Nymphaea thermarum]|nr:YLS3 protein [Nymphaea thermarum]